ncbi:MAG: DMT family transporter [bacterium]|nr:DMT family transporter [bacterium]
MPTELLTALYGLLSAASYGAGDFLGGFNSRKSSLYAVIISSQFVGLMLYLLLAWAGGESFPPLQDIAFGAIGGIIGLIGLFALYRSLSLGRMGITAPVAGIVTAAIPVVVGITTQGVPEPLTLIGFALGLGAVWLVARSPGQEQIDPQVLILPFIAGSAFGIGFLFFARATENSTFFPLAAARITTVTLLTLFVMITRKPFTLAAGRTLPLLAFGGALDAGGNAFFVLAAQSGRIDIAAVLSSMYPAVTVLLAWVILRERLHRSQGTGVVLALLAILLIVL